MNDAPISNINIEIKANAQGATKTISALSQKLEKLGQASAHLTKLKKVDFKKLEQAGKVAQKIQPLKKSLSDLSKLKGDGIAKSLQSLNKVNVRNLSKNLGDSTKKALALAKIKFNNLGQAKTQAQAFRQELSKTSKTQVKPKVRVPKVQLPKTEPPKVAQTSTVTASPVSKTSIQKASTSVSAPAPKVSPVTTSTAPALGENIGALAKIQQAVAQVQGKLAPVQQAFSKVGSAISRVAGHAKKLQSALGGVLGGFGKKLTGGLVNPLKNAGSAIQNFSGKIGNAFSRIGKVAAYRAIRNVLHSITDAFREGIQHMYAYSEASGNTFSSSMDTLATSFAYFKNSIGSAVAPLINMLAPAIDFVIDKVVDFVNMLNMLFAKISGASTWSKAVKQPVKYAEAQDEAGRSAGRARQAQEKLKKSLVGMDELNQLQDNEPKGSGSGGGSGGGGGGANASTMFEEVPIQDLKIESPFSDLLKPFQEAWATDGVQTVEAIKGAFIKIGGLGQSIGESFKEVWTNGTGTEVLQNSSRVIREMSNSAGNFAEKLDEAWKKNDTGTKIVQGSFDILNTSLENVGDTWKIISDGIQETDFSPLLSSFVPLLQKFNNMWDKLGDSMNKILEEIIKPIAQYVVEELAPAINDTLGSAFDAIGEVVETVTNSFTAFFGELQPIGEWLGDTLTEVFDNLSYAFDAVASVFREHGEDIEAIFKAIGETISWVWGVVEPVFTFIKNIVFSVFKAVVDFLKGAIGGIIKMFRGIIDFFKGIFSGDLTKVWEGIKGIFSGAIEFIGGIFHGFWQLIEGIANAIAQGVISAFKGILNIGRSVFTTLKNIIDAVWNGIWSAIKWVVNGILGGIESFANGIISGINFMIRALNRLSFDVPKWVPVIGGNKFGFNLREISHVSLPRLATGGVVDTGQMFIAREAGPELVGSVGRKSVVMNNNQIVASVSDGVEQAVSNANAESNRLLREQNSLLKALLQKENTVTALVDTGDILAGLERRNRRDGRTIVPVGV